MSFEIAAFLRSCIGPRSRKELPGRYEMSRHNNAAFIVYLHGTIEPTFDVIWDEEERLLNIGVYIPVSAFMSIKDQDDALEFAVEANQSDKSIGRWVFIPMDNDDEGEEEAFEDLLFLQAGFRVPPEFDEPSKWGLVRALFVANVLQLLIERATHEKRSQDLAEAMEAETGVTPRVAPQSFRN